MNHNDRADCNQATAHAKPTYVLRLYVSGITPRSTKALANVKAICEEHLAGRYKLVIIDIYQQPLLAKEDKIVAVPILVKLKPAPVSRLIGDMSDTTKVLRGLNLV